MPKYLNVQMYKYKGYFLLCFAMREIYSSVVKKKKAVINHNTLKILLIITTA